MIGYTSQGVADYGPAGKYGGTNHRMHADPSCIYAPDQPERVIVRGSTWWPRRNHLKPVQVRWCSVCTFPQAPGTWALMAACRGMPSEVFFPPCSGNGRPDYTEAREVCGRCPVAETCRDFAISTRVEYGYQNSTPSERRRAWRAGS